MNIIKNKVLYKSNNDLKFNFYNVKQKHYQLVLNCYLETKYPIGHGIFRSSLNYYQYIVYVADGVNSPWLDSPNSKYSMRVQLTYTIYLKRRLNNINNSINNI